MSHPSDDAARTGLTPGGMAKVTLRTGLVVAPVEVTDAIMPGAVSLPHGWGHDVPQWWMPPPEGHVPAGVAGQV